MFPKVFTRGTSLVQNTVQIVNNLDIEKKQPYKSASEVRINIIDK